jgi:hypothetical protein
VRDVTPLIGTDRFADQLTPIEVLLLADPVEIAQKLWPRVVRTQGSDKGTPSNNLNWAHCRPAMTSEAGNRLKGEAKPFSKISSATAFGGTSTSEEVYFPTRDRYGSNTPWPSSN